MYKLEVIFYSGEKLVYNSLETELAQHWFKSYLLPAVYDNDLNTTNIIKEGTHYKFPHFEDKNQLISNLNNGISTLKEFGFTVPLEIKGDYSQPELNILHEYFHTEVENNINSYRESKILKDAITNLNYDIHKLEGTSSKTPDSLNYSVITVKNAKILPPLKKEIKNQFNEETYYRTIEKVESGYLGLINYSTIGKNLLDAYVKDDIDLVKKNLIRSKITGDSQIKFNFSHSKFYPVVETRETTVRKITKWLTGHNIKNVDEYLTDEYLNEVYPPIMEMDKYSRNRFTLSDIYNLHSSDKVYRINIDKKL